MYRRYSAGNFFRQNDPTKLDKTGTRRWSGYVPQATNNDKNSNSETSDDELSDADSGVGGQTSPSESRFRQTGQGLSLSAYIREGDRQQRAAEREAERQFDIWQDNMNLAGQTGGGSGTSPTLYVRRSTSGAGGGGSPTASTSSESQAPPRVTQEQRSKASVPCDDDAQAELMRTSVTSLTALPLSVYATEQPSSEFAFDQYPDMSPAGIVSPEESLNNAGWYFGGYTKHNRMIPSQYYYDSLVVTPYVIRDPRDQKNPEVNLGSRAISNFNLTDHLRYVLGCTWEAGSLRIGTPKTALMLSNDWEIIDPSAQGFLDALARRGIFFCIHPPEEIGISQENLSAFNGVSTFDLSVAGFNVLDNSAETYDTDLVILTNMSILKKMQAANSEIITSDFNVFDYLKRLVERENVINVDAGTSAQGQIRKKMYEHSFRAPTGYSIEETESDRYDPAVVLKDLVSIVPRNRTREQFHTKQHKSEILKNSIYRSFAKAYQIDDKFAGMLVSPNSSADSPNEEITVGGVTRPKRDDKIQKFPSSKVRKIQEINGFIINGTEQSTSFTRVAGNDIDVPFDYWLNNSLSNYNLINFKMNHDSNLALLMQRLSLDTLLFEMIDTTYPFNETYFAQILDTIINLDSELKVQERIDRSSINLRPNEIKNPISLMSEMLNPDENGISVIRDMPFDITTIDTFSYPLGYDGKTANTEKDISGLNEFANMLRNSISEGNVMQGEIPNWSKVDRFLSFMENFDFMYRDAGDHIRTASRIIGGKACHSEVLAYRMEKRDAITGELIQEFLFFNTQGVEDFSFIDSQVLPEKKYTYRIFTINFVIGSEYTYQFESSKFRHPKMGVDMQLDGTFTDKTVPFDSDIGARISPTFVTEEFLDPISDPSSEEAETLDYLDTLKIFIPLKVKPSYKIIEAPYYEQTVTSMTTDRPPIYPDVQVLNSYRTNKDNQSAVMIYPFSRFGFETAEPVAILESDRLVITSMLEAQQRNDNSPDASRIIEYRSDTEPERYEMFYMFEAPEDYSSFGTQGRRLSTSRNKKFFDLNLPFNVKIFVTFRTVDLAGFSNPGPIYCLTRHNYGDGTYTTFEPYEIKKRTPHITCNRLISIEPSIEQKVFNIEDENGDISFNTVPEDLQSITLGKSINESPLIWGRKFKFRFTSVNSHNSFDIDCDFGFNKSVIGTEERAGTSATQSNSENIFDKNRKARRAKNKEESMNNLNKPGTSKADAFDIINTDDPENAFIDPGLLDDTFDEPQDYRETVSDPYSSQFNTSLTEDSAGMSGAINVRNVNVDPHSSQVDTSAVGPPRSTGGGGGATSRSTSGGGLGSADLAEEYRRRQRGKARQYEESKY